MDALGGWLRQVVAAVLLAALIDLLLPNRTMQRYVRLVAGLFILLTLASPLLSWIKGDMPAKVAAGIEWAEREPVGAKDEGQLAQIMAEAKRIGDVQTGQAAKLAVAGLKTQIKTAVEQEEGVAVADVEVSAVVTKEGAIEVSGVTVALTAAAANGAVPRASAPIADVEPVAPVRVDIDLGQVASEPDSESDSEPDSEPATQPDAGGDRPAIAQPADDAADGTPAEAGQSRRIAALIAGRFGIGTDKISVVAANAQQ